MPRVVILISDLNPGRIVQHDPRSLEYKAALPEESQSVLWDYKYPVLDQGKTNYCTGMTLTHFLNTDFGLLTRNKLTVDHFDESTAVKLYSYATTIDEFPGQMPDQDTGSSGLAICKAGQRLEYLTKYEHAFGFDEFLKAIQLSPVMVGSYWYRSMFEPDKEGFIKIIGDDSNMGHEYLALGVDLEKEYVTCLSSWGESYGKNGRFKVSFSDFRDLLSWNGDCIIPSCI